VTPRQDPENGAGNGCDGSAATPKKLVVRVENLRKTFSTPKDTNEILKGIDLAVYAGDFVCILGPSGCGKTTLIRCIAGFERYEGIVEVNGVVVSGPTPDRIMVFQDFNQLFPWLTVEKNIQYPLKVTGTRGKEKLRIITDDILERVGLLAYKNYYPFQLSGGMKQRTAIAKALAISPKIILMDEPFASLDAITRKTLQMELLKIKEQFDITVIFITHNIQEAVMLGNRIIMMGVEGTIKEDMENLLPKPATPATPGFGEIWKHLSDMLEDRKTLSGDREAIS
jgi:NitT/TauT family transport system ATP-binding protein